MEGSLIAPPFKFGMQKSYRVLQEMDSRQAERKKAETTLKGNASQDAIKGQESKATMPTDASKSSIKPAAASVAEVKK